MSNLRTLGWSIALAAALPTAHAQLSVNHFNDPFLQSEGAQALPSLQGLGFSRFSVTVPNFNGWADNTIISYGDLSDILLLSKLTKSDVDEVVDNLDRELYLGFEANVQAVGFGMNVRGRDSIPFLSFGFEHRERTLFSMRIDPDLVSLLYYGNKQYAGKRVIIDPLSIRSLSVRELGGNVAASFRVGEVAGKPITLRPGVGIYYLIGIQGTRSERGQVEMYTQPDGRAIDFDLDYDLNMAIPRDGLNVFSGIGSGMALDLSMGAHIGDALQVYAGINDIGSVQFWKDVRNYRRTGSYHFEGVEYAFGDGEQSSPIPVDSLLSIVDPVITRENFSVDLPTSFILSAQYGFGQKDHEGRPYMKHLVGSTLVSELLKPSWSYAPTAVSVYYTYVAGTRANAGFSFSMRGDTPLGVGVHATVCLGPVRLGLASTNLTPLIAPHSGFGADASAIVQLAF